MVLAFCFISQQSQVFLAGHSWHRSLSARKKIIVVHQRRRVMQRCCLLSIQVQNTIVSVLVQLIVSSLILWRVFGIQSTVFMISLCNPAFVFHCHIFLPTTGSPLIVPHFDLALPSFYCSALLSEPQAGLWLLLVTGGFSVPGLKAGRY